METNTNKTIAIRYQKDGNTAERLIEPKEIWFGALQGETRPQWLLRVLDVSTGEEEIVSLTSVQFVTDARATNVPVAPMQVAAHRVKLYADGGSRGNPGPSASGYVLLDETDQVIKKSGVYLGITTNNQAEYQALKLGLEEAHKLGAREVDVYMDSMLVVNQMKGVFKIRNRDLWPIHEAIKALVGRFKRVSFTHVPRELNKLADHEVNETLDTEAKRDRMV